MAFPKWRPTLPIAVVLALAISTLLALSHTIGFSVVMGTARSMVGSLGADRINARLSMLEQRITALMHPVEAQVAHVQAAFARGDFGNGEDRAAIRHYLNGALAATPQAVGMALLRNDLTADLFGREPGTNRTEDWRGRPRPEEALAWSRTANRPIWAEPTLSEVARKVTVITLRAPLTTPAGHLGLVAAAVTVEGLSRFTAEMTEETGETTFILYDRDRVLAHPHLVRPWDGVSPENPLPRLDEVNDPVVAVFWNQERQPPPDVAKRLKGSAGSVRVGRDAYTVLYRTITADGHEFTLASYLPGMIVEDELAALFRAAGIGVLILVLGIGLSVLVGRVISKPVLRLARTAEDLQSKHLEDVKPVPKTAIREINTAGSAFNQMLLALRERQRIRDLFGRYVSPTVVERLLKDPDAALLGGRRQEVSLLFTDITGFTTLSEAYPPETVVPLLNEYLEHICRLVADGNGVVVDFIGDAVFALFGAPVSDPDHAARALGVAAAIDAFAVSFSRTAAAAGVPFGMTRMGLHAGPAMVGNFGSVERLKYGAAGDTVNTASRLEGANRLFATRRLASRYIVDRVPGCQARPLARLSLKGRREPLDVFEPLTEQEADDGWLARYRAAYALLGAELEAALSAFDRLAQERPEDPVVAFHLTRLRDGVSSPFVSFDGK